ncbi:MAG: glycosyltransferase family 9 protein [Candidatus Acidiferrales bacterium]
MKPNEASRLREPAALLPGLPQGAEILVIRLRSLGDLVLETPAIAALHSWRPDLRIAVLVEPRFAAVLEGNPAIAEQIFSSGGTMETARKLRARHFPIVLNQHGGPRSAILTGFSGSPKRVGWKSHQYSFLYNVHAPDAKEFYGAGAVHTVEHRISQFYWAGLPRGPIPHAAVFPQPDAAKSIARKLAEKGIGPGMPYAVLQPGARLPEMRWPVARFAELAPWLRELHGVGSVVNLGAGDAEIAAEVQREMQNCSVIPETPLDIRELIALIAGSRIVIGNDSGPIHIAAALQRPSVAVFSVTDPVQWHPWQSPHHIVQTDATFHHPRGDKSIVASNPRPITSIAFEEVRDACEDLLSDKSS